MESPDQQSGLAGRVESGPESDGFRWGLLAAHFPGYGAEPAECTQLCQGLQQGISNLSAFVTTKTRYGKLSLQSTSLFNHNTRFDNEYVYGNSLEYRPDDRLTLYGSLQRIYSVPTLDELYYNNANRDSDGAWKIRGNEHLQPETGLKWNGGIRYRLNDHSTLDANAFVSHINNPIVWYKEAGAWTPKNLESQNKSGLQLTWEDRFSPRYGSLLPMPGPGRTPPAAGASIPGTPMRWRPMPSRRP